MGPLPVGNALREELLELERTRAEAMVREDVGTLARLLAEDLSYTHSDGRKDTKESLLNLIAAPAMHYLGIDYSNQEVIDCGDTVIVRGTARIRLLRDSGERPDYLVLFLDVWVRRDGRWQTMGWQATRVATDAI
jgi:ketosteroid isomerase-like protein